MRYSTDDESTSQSQHSPGPVKESEELLRVLFYPEHVKDGLVLETAIPLEDLRERGFGVDRRGRASRSVIEQRISRQMANENKREERQESTISKMRCGAVRGVLNEDRGRACIVIDTASADNPAHASIYSAKVLGAAGLRKVRSLILPLLQDRYTLEELFSES
jgi:hypothetical protein